MHDLTNANMDGIEDISEREIEEMRGYAQSIANMLEVVMVSKSIPTGSIYWRAAKILSKMDNYLDKHEGDHANVLRSDQGVLVDAELLDHLQGVNIEPVTKPHSRTGFVYKNGKVVESESVGKVVASISEKAAELEIQAHKGGNNRIGRQDMKLLGFVPTDSYYSPKDSTGLGMDIYTNFGDVSGNEISDNYDFVVDLSAGDIFNDIFVENMPDLYELLGKYLPVVKLGGDLILFGKE